MRCLLTKFPRHKESNTALHWTGIPLRSIPASELYRSTYRTPDEPVKPGPRDKAIKLKFSRRELKELKRHTWRMADSFGLDRRIEAYEGTRPISFHRWDVECLLDVLDGALKEMQGNAERDSPGYLACKRLRGRLQQEYNRTWE